MKLKTTIRVLWIIFVRVSDCNRERSQKFSFEFYVNYHKKKNIYIFVWITNKKLALTYEFFSGGN